MPCQSINDRDLPIVISRSRTCLMSSAGLCAAASLNEPDMLADELFLLLEGARVTAQCMGRDRLGDRLVRMGETMITAHEPKKR